MSVVDASPEAQEVAPINGLELLQQAVVLALGDFNRPLNASALVAALPREVQELFYSHVYHLEYPGKGHGRPEVAFIENYFANPRSLVEYVYGATPGYALNDAGLQHYREIIEAHEQETIACIPEAQPAADSVVRSVGGGTLAAVWAG